MLTPERLLRFMIELIFVLLGSLVVWLGLARRIYGPAQCRMVDSQRGADPMGLARALQAGPVVVALAELDARAFARSSGRPHACDFPRAVCLGWSDAGGRRWPAGAARYDWRVPTLPPPLKKCLPARPPARPRARPFPRLSFFSSSTMIP